MASRRCVYYLNHARPCLRLSTTPITALLTARHSSTKAHGTGTSWGFIGLGQMGYNMARNLRTKIPTDDLLYIHDINAEATKKFVDEMAGYAVRIAGSARELAEKSETVISALPSPPHVESVYSTIIASPALPALPARRLFIDTSTIDPRTSTSVGARLGAARAGTFVDAPMSGGAVGAAAGTLTFMLGAPSPDSPAAAGGREDVVERATAALRTMGARVAHMGGPGAGLLAKLANNYLLAAANVATCEAMRIGVAAGLDPARLAALISASSGRCWPADVNNPVPGVVPGAPAGRGYEGGFAVRLMEKDLRLALGVAKEAGVKTELGEKVVQVYDEVGKTEMAGLDFSVVYRWLEEGGRKTQNNGDFQ